MDEEKAIEHTHPDNVREYLLEILGQMKQSHAKGNRLLNNSSVIVFKPQGYFFYTSKSRKTMIEKIKTYIYSKFQRDYHNFLIDYNMLMMTLLGHIELWRRQSAAKSKPYKGNHVAVLDPVSAQMGYNKMLDIALEGNTVAVMDKVHGHLKVLFKSLPTKELESTDKKWHDESIKDWVFDFELWRAE